MRFSDRGLLVPNYWAWASFQKRYFSECKSSGRSLSPDNSVRHLFRLSGPIKTPAKAVLLYGKSGTGKTSRGRDLVNGKGYEHLQLDSIFLDWHYEIESHIPMSVSDFVDSIWSGDSFYENTTPAWRQKIYLDYYRRYLDRWLGARQNLNVVIDGYDPIYPEFRAMLHAALNENGWLNITETECK